MSSRASHDCARNTNCQQWLTSSLFSRVAVVLEAAAVGGRPPHVYFCAFHHPRTRACERKRAEAATVISSYHGDRHREEETTGRRGARVAATPGWRMGMDGGLRLVYDSYHQWVICFLFLKFACVYGKCVFFLSQCVLFCITLPKHSWFAINGYYFSLFIP